MKVLFATDGGDAAHHAARLLSQLADRARVHVTALSVSSFSTALKEAESVGHYSPEAAHAHAEEMAAEAASWLRDAGFETDHRVADGDEATAILNTATEAGTELIVVGTGKERWVDVAIMGSTSSSVLHASPCPILVVHRVRDEGRRPRALVATDGSEGAARAVETFAALVDAERCDVHVVSVARPGDEEDMRDAQGHAEVHAAALRDEGFSATAQAVTGHATRTLLQEIQDGDYDLVVAGSRGLGRFQAKVLGSVSDRLVRHAPASLIGR
jgi:nucleotide-binding universal stress UspA family protein